MQRPAIARPTPIWDVPVSNIDIVSINEKVPLNNSKNKPLCKGLCRNLREIAIKWIKLNENKKTRKVWRSISS
jgi:hypothetical protein